MRDSMDERELLIRTYRLLLASKQENINTRKLVKMLIAKGFQLDETLKTLDKIGDAIAYEEEKMGRIRREWEEVNG